MTYIKQKMIIKKFLFLMALCMTFVLGSGITVLAKEETPELEPYGVTDGTTIWVVDSKTNLGRTYGAWRIGPSATGPGGDLSINKSFRRIYLSPQ